VTYNKTAINYKFHELSASVILNDYTSHQHILITPAMT